MAKKAHPGTLRQAGRSWQLVIWNKAAKKTQTYTLGPRELDLDTARDLAFKKARALQKEVKREKLGLPGTMLLSELIVTYKRDKLETMTPGSQATYGVTLSRFGDFFTACKLDPNANDVQAAHIRQYLRWRAKEDGVSERTLGKDRAVLSAMFRYAAREMEVVDNNPVANVATPKGDKREPVILTAEQYEKLLEACDDHDMLRLYVLILGESGVRCDSEALHLRWEDVSFEGCGWLWVAGTRDGHRSKSGKGRWIPCTARLRKALAAHCMKYQNALYNGQASEWVLHHVVNGPGFPAGSRWACFYTQFKVAAKQAGLPKALRQHDLRHRRVTTWLADEQSPALVQQAMGHSSIAITMGYSHLAKAHLAKLVEEPETPAPPARQAV
jgi:integrase/recombinase XerD